jgi:hypothetical protein
MYLFWDGYYLPGKSCRPITYPDARRTTKTFFLVTSDPIDKVLQFYNQQLDAQPLYLADTGDWKQEQLSNTKYLFSCYGNDINLLTTESGCIYVSIEGSFTRIEGDLVRSEGSNIPCSRK